MSKQSVDEFMSDVIKELDTKIDQLDTGLRLGHVPSRMDLEKFVWKTGRVTRQLVKPEKNDDRRLFWSECKGILKRVLDIDSFNPGIFSSNCVRQDIIENDLLDCLQLFRRYVQDRQSGVIKAPARPLDDSKVMAKRARKEVEAKEKREREEVSHTNGKTVTTDASKNPWGDDVLAAKWDTMLTRKSRWDDEDSDPDEDCPDREKFGTCAYGRQCGFAKCLAKSGY